MKSNKVEMYKKIVCKRGQREIIFILVPPLEIDIANSKISVDSPYGKALLGRGLGEEVMVDLPDNNKEKLLILRILEN